MFGFVNTLSYVLDMPCRSAIRGPLKSLSMIEDIAAGGNGDARSPRSGIAEGLYVYRLRLYYYLAEREDLCSI